MNARSCRKLLPAVQVLLVLCTSFAIAASEPYPEHEVKAAFLYNFIKFATWPTEKVQDANQPMVIFVVGKYPKCKTFDEIQKKDSEHGSVQVRIFDSYEQISDPNILKTCHVLFICGSEKKNVARMLAPVRGNNVLTVGEFEGFLDRGGVINFVRDEERIRFEISIRSAEETGIKLRSKLLRLAKRVIQEGTEEGS